MKRIHVIAISFMCGMLAGLTVPQAAYAGKAPATSYEDFVIDSVDSNDCTVSLETGDVYAVDCEDLDNYQPGETVTLAINKNWTTLETESGNGSFAEEQ